MMNVTPRWTCQRWGLAAGLNVWREGVDSEIRTEHVVDSSAAPPGAVSLLLLGDETDGALDSLLCAPDKVRRRWHGG